jgi:hypothetical protein
MTDWSLPSKDLAFIRRAGDPPQDPSPALRDPNWSHLFFKWAEDKRDGGNPQPLYLYQLESCLAPENSLTLKEHYPKFFVAGAEWPIPVPDDLKSQAKSVVEDRSPDINEDTVVDNLRFYVDPSSSTTTATSART